MFIFSWFCSDKTFCEHVVSTEVHNLSICSRSNLVTVRAYHQGWIAPNMIFKNTPMQLPTTLEFGPFWNVTRVKSSFFFWFCSDKTMRTTWFLRKHTTSLFVPDHILITAWITVLVGFEIMNTWCQYGRKMQLNKHDVGYTSFLR